MNIRYKKTPKGYEYEVDEPFGVIKFTLENEIKNEEVLDDIFMVIYSINEKAKEIEGNVMVEENMKDKVKQDKIPYTFSKKANTWEDVFSDKEKKFIEDHLNIEYSELRRKDIDKLSAAYTYCGYKLDDSFSKILTDFKIKYDPEN